MRAVRRGLILLAAALSLSACGSDAGKWDRLRMSNRELDRVQAGSVGWDVCTPGADCAVSFFEVIDQRPSTASSTCGATACTTSAVPSTGGPTTISQSYVSPQTTVTQTQILPPVGQDPMVKAAQDAWARRQDWLLRPR